MISAISAYTSARNTIAPSGSLEKLGAAADEFARVMGQTDQAASAVMSGEGETHQLVQAIAEAELALETAVSIRDKVVEAYQEILRMPV